MTVAMTIDRFASLSVTVTLSEAIRLRSGGSER